MATERFGRYQLLEQLGQGGMGQVFRAHDTATDRIVAVKVLPAHLADDSEFQQRFRREARMAAGLSDPHVVPIHSYGEIDGRLYVDMRLIEGRDLDTIIADVGGPLDAQRAVAIIEQVAAALVSAHGAGLVHRDVKPSNILIAARDFAYLIDFGIARVEIDTSVTRTGHTVGTLAYMAPERFCGAADPRSDIYALACVLYECLTGHQPFPGHSMEEQIAGHLTKSPPRPSASIPDISSALDEVIARGMAKRPDDRYQTASEFADACRGALNGGFSDTVRNLPPQPPTQQAPLFEPAIHPRNLRRNTPYLSAFLAVALVGTYVLVGFMTRDEWTNASSHDQTRVTLSGQTADGSPASSDALSKTGEILRARLNGLGITGAEVVLESGNVIVTVPGSETSLVRNLIQPGRLYIRPVIDAVPIPSEPATAPPPITSAPAAPTSPTAPSDPHKDLADTINFQKQLRQTPALAQVALSVLMEQRCQGPDPLAGNDDPAQPLVTCSTDRTQIYYLDKSIISGDQIDNASSGYDQQGNQWVVNVKFKSAAANTWADFTAAHVGTQTAFTLDSQVVSAPAIREAIPGGNTQITGNFTASKARDLANTLGSAPLPLMLSFESSNTEAVQGRTGSTPLRIGLIASGIGVALIVICLVIYSVRRRSPSFASS